MNCTYHNVDAKHPDHFAGNDAKRVERQALGFNQDAFEKSEETAAIARRWLG